MTQEDKNELQSILAENNKMLIEAIGITVKKEVDLAFQAQTARQEIFEDKISGM